MIFYMHDNAKVILCPIGRILYGLIGKWAAPMVVKLRYRVRIRLEDEEKLCNEEACDTHAVPLTKWHFEYR